MTHNSALTPTFESIPRNRINIRGLGIHNAR